MYKTFDAELGGIQAYDSQNIGEKRYARTSRTFCIIIAHNQLMTIDRMECPPPKKTPPLHLPFQI